MKKHEAEKKLNEREGKKRRPAGDAGEKGNEVDFVVVQEQMKEKKKLEAVKSTQKSKNTQLLKG